MRLCRACSSGNLQDLTSELCLHRPAELEDAVFVFPTLTVCMECGFAEFTFPAEELTRIKEIGSAQKDQGPNSSLK